jgi:hypothetical protein
MPKGHTPRIRKASERVRSEWLRRVEAEYRSAALTQHLGLWLIQIGASPDLIRDGLRIVQDELRHAELSHRVYVAAGGRTPPRIVRETLELAHTRAAPLEHDVLRAALETFCLGETLAVRLFKELRRPCTVAPARRALDRILRDEVRHRDFGWALFEWLSATSAGPDLHVLAVRELPEMLERLRASYAPPGAEAETEIDDADAAWGLMPGARYAKTLHEVLARDYTPRFARFELDAGAAWSRDGRTAVSSG